MVSLTPESKRDEASSDAFYEGLFNGMCTLIPTGAVVGILYQRNPNFRRLTNWQSRTALVIMPALAIANFTSENYLMDSMRQMARENQHHQDTVNWAEKQYQHNQQSGHATHMTETQHLAALFQQSVQDQDVNIVPELHWYHRMANYTAASPFKVLATIAVPSVAYIFYGRKSSLPSSVQIMHTRVIGQFFTVSLFLSIMGIHQWMDQHGRFISQQEADERVEEMVRVRQSMHDRLQVEQQRQMEMEELIRQAHEEDEAEKKTKKTMKRSKQQKQQLAQAMEPFALTEDE